MFQQPCEPASEVQREGDEEWERKLWKQTGGVEARPQLQGGGHNNCNTCTKYNATENRSCPDTDVKE